MSLFACKKVENCFSGAHIYDYRLNSKATEEWLTSLAAGGSIKFFKHFPRPCFQADLPDGTTLKGVIADTVIKASFPSDNPEASKHSFEKLLTALLAPPANDKEN